MHRRLTAIVAADVVAYSRMIRADEDGTLEALHAVRRDVVDPEIERHGGRIVKLMGDGLLAEFTSIVDAVRAAVAVQQAMPEWNAGREDARHIVFRVGVNLGDVVIDGEELQGDGINVAARLEALAEPGTVCVSDAVHEQVRDRLTLRFEDLGAQELKNIDRPIRVWRWSREAPEAASAAVLDFTKPDLPIKPSIAVLPFDNMSSDPEQAFFVDGLVEDIITALSRNGYLFVIARNSSFTYRGAAVDLRQVGKELGVRFVLEGSVRRGANRLRITAQLIEAETGSHVWAERYDRPLDDLFEVQDEITQAVSAAVGSEIMSSDMTRAGPRRIEDLHAWERLMKAYWHLNRLSAEDVRIGQDICQAEIATTGGSAVFYAASTIGYMYELLYDLHGRSAEDVIRDGMRMGYAGLKLDPNNELVLLALSIMLRLSGDFDGALRMASSCIELYPNSLMSHLAMGNCLAYLGADHAEGAIGHLEMTIRLAPRDALLHWSYCNIAVSHFTLEDYAAAIEHAHTAIRMNVSNGSAHRILVAALALSGQIDAAKTAWLRVWEMQPFDPPVYIATMRRIIRSSDVTNRLFKGLRLAGAPLEADAGVG